MNYIEQSTAKQNLKKAEMVRNKICDYASFEARLNSILDSLNAAAAKGKTKMAVNSVDLEWKNEQGVSVKQAIENKGYFFTEHWKANYFSIHSAGDYTSYSEVDYCSAVAEKQLSAAWDPENYDMITLITMDGAEGDTLEKVMEYHIAEKQKELNEARARFKELMKEVTKEMEENKNRNSHTPIDSSMSGAEIFVFTLFALGMIALIIKLLT